MRACACACMCLCVRAYVEGIIRCELHEIRHVDLDLEIFERFPSVDTCSHVCVRVRVRVRVCVPVCAHTRAFDTMRVCV